ncbi:glycosyl transferase family protein [Ponticoccus alexandrii]|uniref:Glycosyl transferase family protein n=1 Tax=Ponticoccus alexandrii TaxID=1943633 RepID=A0ABX7FEA6_9RHOB|nr:glycosyl transferase family protein [Ponticoccus alexandrii]ETA49635.1 glycosyl transferase family 3 [Rhodobacteraceae bacterium PD-2]QRF68886.1 glycosyl transferase family protein [Ponticoccus alexandrii]
MTLAPYVRILGRGQGRARSFTRAEAQEAMTLMMQGDADPEAVGAILMLLRMKGETAEEIAGFADAARDALPPWPGPAPSLDWPSYAAGRTRGLPWFLLAAKLVAEAGYPVLLHGWNAHQARAASVRAALPALGIAVATGPGDAAARLQSDGIAYLPLETLCPRLFELLGLRDVLGLRSCINTVLRMLNPASAPAAVQGVFHPPYRELQADAARILGLQNLTVLKGGGGEFEHHPAKNIQTFGVRAGRAWSGSTGTQVAGHRRLSEGGADPGDLRALWEGTRHDAFAEAIILSTADLALETCGAAPDARTLWSARRARVA